jgi:predicted alpha/beta-hydrolase family hydrolase
MSPIILDTAPRADAPLFVCAHGAGSDMNHRSMARLAAALLERGVSVARFNFPYREKGSRRPDPMPVLRASYEAAVQQVRGRGKLVIGGRSMGGRVASLLAADGFACDGLLLVAYPLHPAGQPEKLRDAHLPRIRVPVLCFNGTRDALCRKDLMDNAVGKIPGWDMRWLEGADHSLAREQDLRAIADAAAAWRI